MKKSLPRAALAILGLWVTTTALLTWPHSTPPRGDALSSPTAPAPAAPRQEDETSQILECLTAAIANRAVWKDEIQKLIALDELVFRSKAASGIKERLLERLRDPRTDPNLAGLLAFVLTAQPTDAGRLELARLLGRSQANDASLVHALTVRVARVGRDLSRREAFWKGCLDYLDRESLATLGFRERLFKEEYGHDLEYVRRNEAVKPSAADRFEDQILAAFHDARKQGFTTFILPGDVVRGPLLEYLRTGASPEAKRHICIVCKPGPDLALAARDAFVKSKSYPGPVRRWIFNRALDGGTWETLHELLPDAGDLKADLFVYLARASRGDGDREDRTFALLREELSRLPEDREETGRLLQAVAELKSERGHAFLMELCRTASNGPLRERAIAGLASGALESMGPERHQQRIDCAESILLNDPAPRIRVTAALALEGLLSESGRLSNPKEVRRRVDLLVEKNELPRKWADRVYELLDTPR